MRSRLRSRIRIRAMGKATATHPHHRGDWPSTSRPSMNSRVVPISGTDEYHSAWLHSRQLGGSGCALADLGCAFVAAVCTIRARGLQNTTIKQQKAAVVAEVAAEAAAAVAAQRRRQQHGQEQRQWWRQRQRQRQRQHSGGGIGSAVAVAANGEDDMRRHGRRRGSIPSMREYIVRAFSCGTAPALGKAICSTLTTPMHFMIYASKNGNASIPPPAEHAPASSIACKTVMSSSPSPSSPLTLDPSIASRMSRADS